MKKLTLGFFKLCLLTLGIGFLITSLATNFSIINTDSLWEDGIDRTFFGLNEPERSGSFTTILADFDNDGLDDLSDLDDDNDGILDVDEGCVGQDVDLGVDGTFEALAGIASSDAYNSNVTAGGWFNGVGSADSWISPMPTTGTGVWGGLADGTPSSPDGGVFIGAWARGTGRESFYIDLTGLIIGQDYILKFYQANAGVEGSTVLGNNARWEVHFGTQVQFSPEMPYLGEGNQVWQEETMQFTASQTTQRLEFFSDDAADGTPGTSRDCIAIDGVRLFEAASTSTACTGQDTDGDGSPDHLDNDADGDGCPDALEGTGTFVIGDLDANDQLTGGVDANGIPLVATASGQGLGSSNDPGVQSCPPPPPSATDNALSFNSNDWVGVANASDFNVGASTDFTIQGIVQTTFDAPGASRTIFSKMQNGSIQGYQLWAWQGKLLLEWAKNGSINLLGGTTTIADGQCHHVAVVVDRSAETVKLYVDGVLDATQNNTDISSDINNSADVFIGKERTNNSAFFWRGEIDELAFFTSARSDAEIAQSASNALTGSEAGLLAYWKFDSGVAGADNSGVTTAIDETGGNDGTLNGFSLDGTETETGANGTVVTGTWVASSCSVDPSGLQFVVGTETSGPSNTVIVPITVNDFDDVATYQGTITFDPNVLTFVDATSPLPGGTSSFGDPGQGTIPNNSITFSWYDPGFNTSSLPDGTVVMELEFTVASNATTGFTDVQINGSATPLGYSTDPAATVLSDPTVTQGGVTIDADAPTVDVINIVSNNANDITLATIADVITLSFTTSETPAQAPVVTIVEGGTGAVTLGGSGTSYTATKTVATGGDGLVTFSIQIEDQYGNSSTATATTDGSQVIVDTEDPTITCPADVNEDTDAGVCGRVVSFTDPVGADNLPGHSVAQTGGPASGSTFPVGTTTITYTVTDAAGNTATCDFDITITDNEAPNVITQPFTVQLDANGSASISVNDIDNGSSDACGIATSVLDITSFSCADLGNNTVTLTVTDVNGNSASATAVVTVEDVIPPTITCPAPQTISTDLGLCTAALPDLTGLATVDDNCEGTGGSGNGVVSPATKLAMGSFHSLAVADDGTLWSWGSNFFGKLGIGSGNSSFNQTSPAQASSSTDWEAVAAGGNHSLALKTDGTLWAWGFNSSGQLGTGNNTQQNSPVQVGSDTDWAMVRAGANHSMALKTDGTLWAWGVNQNGTLGIGNTNNQNSPVQVGTDTDWILISAGIQHSAALKSDGTAWAWGANDDGALGIGNTITQNSPVQIGTDTDWASISAGGDNADQHTIALKSDGSLWAWGTNDDGELGNGSSSGIATSPIQVGSDTDWAMAQAGANHSMALKSDGTFWFWGSRANGVSGTGGNTSSNETSPIQSGNSSDWLEFGIGNANHIIALQNNNSLFGWGFNSAGQVGKGNTSSANVPFAVTGFTPQASGSGLGSSSGSSSGLTVTQSPAVGTPLAVGPHTVTITVTDASGNTASCDVSVTVEDNEAPTVVTQNIIVQLDASGNASITAAQVDGGSTDPCGIASITVSPETFTCGDVGVNQVTLTVTDVNGNVATGTADVTVEDNILPTVSTQNVTVQLDASGNGSVTAAQVDAGSSDNCGIASLSVSPSTFTCAEVGANTVTLTVTDVNGNVETGTATVTVEDNVLPTVSTQNVTVQLDASGNVSVTAAQVDAGSSDNCGIASLSVSPSTFTCAEVGANTVTLTVTDVNGNVETGTATVTVEDNVLPTVSTQNVTVQLDASGNASVTAAQVDAGSSDNCGIASITVSPSTFTCSEEGANTVTLTVTDVNGNVETGTATVTVEDNILPTVVTQDISVQLDAAGNASITAAQIDNGSSDNCGVANISVSPNNFTCAEVGANTVTLTVTDVNGNVETGTATVTVLDDPIIDVSGKSVSELGDDIPGVIYDLAGDDGPQTTTGLNYTFQVAPCGSTNDIGGDKVDDAATNNGVDVLDAFDIVKHLLLIEQLGSPYKLIAADVNATGSINILDAFQVLRKVNFIIPYFTNPTTGAQDAIWTFIPDDYVFADPLNPWNFETRRDILSPNANLTDQDFIGVKLGDVNNTWNPSQLRTAPPTDSMFFNLDGMTAEQGDLIRIPVKVNKFSAITGYQFTLNWDPSVLEFQEVNHEALEGVYGLDGVRNGIMTTAWVDFSGESISLEDGTVAFEMVFRAIGGKDSKTEFKITSDVTASKAYDITRELLGIGFASEEININRGNGELAEYSFDQNVPNPFGEATNLLFSLPKAEKVQIVIYNLNGQLIKRFDGTYLAGDHQIKWDGRNEKGMEVSEGIYMAQMVAGDFSAAIRISKNR